MNILVINTIPFDLNGMSMVIMNYYQYMDRTNIHFDFIANNYIDKSFKNIIEKNGDRVYILKSRNKYPFNYIKTLRELYKKNHYTAVHIHGNSATIELELFAFRKIKIYKIVHAHGVNTQHPFIHKILNPFFQKSYDIGLAASKNAGNWLFKNKKFHIIRNGIDTDKFKFDPSVRAKIRSKYNLNKNLVLLHVGAFTEQKNQQFLIKVFYKFQKQKHNARLLLAGKGKFINEIKQQTKSLGIANKVLFLGEFHNIAQIYSAADIFVFPSKFEPFGIVALEAQDSGLPCVLSNVLPKAVKQTTNVKFLPLKINSWVDFLKTIKIQTNEKRNSHFDLNIKKGGYSIKENAKDLRNLFLKLNSQV